MLKTRLQDMNYQHVYQSDGKGQKSSCNYVIYQQKYGRSYLFTTY